MPFAYEFFDSLGRLCCGSDDPKHLCEKCRALASSNRTGLAPSRAYPFREVHPTDDPDYDPFGTPANVYSLAIARMKEQR